MNQIFLCWNRPATKSVLASLSVLAMIGTQSFLTPSASAQVLSADAPPQTLEARESTPSVAIHLEDIGPIEARGESRGLPLKLYLPDPETHAASCPVVLVSHGLGGSREGMAYLGQALAAHGYVVVHMQHMGSDESIWVDVEPRARMRAIRRAIGGAAGRELWQRRNEDVTATLDYLAALPETHPAHGRLDLDHVGIAGHSFGAHTVMAMAGQQHGFGARSAQSYRDDRIDAAVAYSPAPPNRRQRGFAYDAIQTPILHMTGTEDQGMITAVRAEDRRMPFDLIPDSAPDQYLVVFGGGDHLVFYGGRWRGAGPTTPEQDVIFQALTTDATLHFLDAYLREDDAARVDLREAYAGRLGELGTFEVK